MSDLCVTDHGDSDRRAIPSLRLCPTCRDGLAKDLAALPRLWHDLGKELGSPAVVTTVSTGPRPARDDDKTPLTLAETKLPINPAVSALREQIKHDLVWWVLEIARARGLTGLPGNTVKDCAEWLGKHVDWLSAQADTAETCPPVFRELAGRAYALLRPSGARRIEIGPCRDSRDGERCTGTLWATVRREDDVRPSVIYCDGCGTERGAEEWRRFGRDYLRQAAS